jgi:hypothetical protein
MRPVVFGTAGHIDHGKTWLVRALTGVDCDRLPEEKRRGITLVLGFAPMVDPAGEVEVSFIDVPGHERLVHTMIAGAGGIDRALLVVAADEGVMPQTREHLDVLGLLAVPGGVVALNKARRARGGVGRERAGRGADRAVLGPDRGRDPRAPGGVAGLCAGRGPGALAPPPVPPRRRPHLHGRGNRHGRDGHRQMGHGRSG